MFNAKAILFFAISASVLAKDPELRKDDGVEFRFPAPSRLLIIGDQHADPDAMPTILESLGYVDPQGNWSAGDAVVLGVGDDVSRGESSRFILDYRAFLDKQAKKKQGKADAIGGNHEQLSMMQDWRYPEKDFAPYLDLAPDETEENIGKYIRGQGVGTVLKPATQKNLEKVRQRLIQLLGREGFRWAVSHPDSPIAREFASRNTIAQYGKTVVVHAGLDDWMGKDPIQMAARINATIREWNFQQLRFNAGLVDQAPEAFWLTDDPGPLWTRRFGAGVVPALVINRILKGMGASRIVVGHDYTPDSQIAVKQGGAIYMIDTSIQDRRGGRLSALEIIGDEVIRHDNIPRGPYPHPIRARLEPMFQQGRRQHPILTMDLARILKEAKLRDRGCGSRFRILGELLSGRRGRKSH